MEIEQKIYGLKQYAGIPESLKEKFVNEPLLPSFLTSPFYASLGALLIILGLMLLLGLWSRVSLVRDGPDVYGADDRVDPHQAGSGVSSLGMHIALICGALVLSKYNRFFHHQLMNDSTKSAPKAGSMRDALNRRRFLQAAATASAGLMLAKPTRALAQEKSSDLRIAICGLGAQGKVLIDATLKIPGIKFVAVCDIWEYARKYGQRLLKKRGTRSMRTRISRTCSRRKKTSRRSSWRRRISGMRRSRMRV